MTATAASAQMNAVIVVRLIQRLLDFLGLATISFHRWRNPQHPSANVIKPASCK